MEDEVAYHHLQHLVDVTIQHVYRHKALQ
jgi:hypothetical protein